MTELTEAMMAPVLAEAAAKTENAVAAVRSEYEERIGVASKERAEAVRLQREASDKLRDINLLIEQGISAQVSVARETARKEADAALSLRLAEKDTLIASAMSQVENLTKKLEQGSQQTQGEVFEIEMASRLRSVFPSDTVSDVPKGVCGADLLHTTEGGVIQWELKRTKNWSDSWLAKTRADQRASKADVAIIVTFALPKSIEVFGQIEGVWICTPTTYLALAGVIRAGLYDVKSARRSMDGMKTKAEAVYEYLTSPQFKNRVGAIIETFEGLREQLDAEQKAMARVWAKRGEMINRVITSTASMAGEMQAIAGKSLGEFPALELPK